MQRYSCVICKGDSFGGGSMIHEGMFFKMCKECYEDENAVKLLTDYLCSIADNIEGEESEDNHSDNSLQTEN